jgi:hypothetical protein
LPTEDADIAAPAATGRYRLCRVDYPSLKGPQMLALLRRKPFEYRQKPGKTPRGSHRHLVSPNGYPDLAFWCHDSGSLPAYVVKEILMGQIGLSDEQARAAIRGKLK